MFESLKSHRPQLCFLLWPKINFLLDKRFFLYNQRSGIVKKVLQILGKIWFSFYSLVNMHRRSLEKSVQALSVAFSGQVESWVIKTFFTHCLFLCFIMKHLRIRQRHEESVCFIQEHTHLPVQLSPRWSATIAILISVRSHGLCGPTIYNFLIKIIIKKHPILENCFYQYSAFTERLMLTLYT